MRARRHCHADKNRYQVQPLVSDVPGAAPHVDAHLVNGWGVAFNPNGFVWVSDNGTGLSTLYDGLGNPQALVVTIPRRRAATTASRRASCSAGQRISR